MTKISGKKEHTLGNFFISFLQKENNFISCWSTVSDQRRGSWRWTAEVSRPYARTLSRPLSAHPGCRVRLSRAPCAVRQVPWLSFLTQRCVLTSLNLPNYPLPPCFKLYYKSAPATSYDIPDS